MSVQAPKSSKPATKPPNQNQPTSRSSSLSSHLAMVELKQRIITSLSKLADRDTHQIAIEDLHSITQSITPESLPMLLNSLYDSLSDSSNAKPSVKKESLHLLSLTCQSHRDLTLPHLTKIIAHIVKRLKDSDSSVKDACRDAIGVLSGLYLKPGNGNGNGGGGDSNGVGSMVGLFVRPLFEAMGEQNKSVQSGAAACMAKMVDCAAMEGNDNGGNGNVSNGAFQKLCPRICKLLNGQNFIAKAALLGVVTSLAQYDMAVKVPRSPKLIKLLNHSPMAPTSTRSSLANHFSNVAFKQQILLSLSKLADHDMHQLALQDLQSIIHSLSPGTLPLLLNSLYVCSSNPTTKSIVKKDSLHLLSLCCQIHYDLKLTRLTKIIAHIVKMLKDSDPIVRNACCDVIGVLSGLYLKEREGAKGRVLLFVRPLFEAMRQPNKVVQLGAAMCMGKMVKCAIGKDMHVEAFRLLFPRVCKLLTRQNFHAKATLLGVVASLLQVGAIVPQGLEPLLQSIQECLGSADWATRKAAADALVALALHSSSLISDGAANSVVTVLESCRFDKIKPVRDSMTEALQLWKKIAGKSEDGALDNQKASAHDGKHPEKAELPDTVPNPVDQKAESSAKESSRGASPNADPASKGKVGSIPDKAVVILKKKAPALTDKDLNPEFFQKLQTRGSGDLPVEVVVPRRCINSSNLNEEDSEAHDSDSRVKSNRKGNSQSDDPHGSSSKYRNIERGNAGNDSRARAFDDDRLDVNPRELSGSRAGFSKSESQSEGSFINSKGNWLVIQRQLLQLERQQSHLMNMLQDFMGGSHDSMITLENRVRGLERIVEDIARDLSISSGRRGGSFPIGFEGSNRPLGKYNGFSEYSGARQNSRVPFGERFSSQSDVSASGMRGRGPHWRSDMSDAWDFPTYASRNGQVGLRRGPSGSSIDGRSPKSESESDQVGSRRAWEKGVGPVRLGEGPSARSVWQASKDEATLEAIRVAGEDNGLSRAARRVAIPEMTAEAMGDDNSVPERDPIWTSWGNAMDAFKMGDVDTAYAEVVSTGDDFLLIKLMERSGPVVDQLSNETACEVLHAIVQFLLEQNLFDICLSWIHQLVDILLENGPDAMGIPMELKKDLLLNLHEASTTMDAPEDWEGAAPDQLLMQLAAAWDIELQQFDK